MPFTFSMIKPEAVAKGHVGAILQAVEQAGFRIAALSMTRLSAHEAAQFYAIHQKRPFFESLCQYMCSGPIVALVLTHEKEAVAFYRTIIGHTDPKQAAPNTLRQRFGTSIEANAVHGSDSEETAQTEADFFFAHRARFDLD